MRKKNVRKIVFTGKIIVLLVLPLIFLLLLVWKFQGEGVKKAYVSSRIEQKITAPFKNYPKVLWLKTAGNKIVNENNETMILRGVNVASLSWGFDTWNAKAVSWAIKEWHANVIRARIIPNEFKKGSGDFFLRLEDQIIEPARLKGTYVILHSFQNNSPDDLPDKATFEMWRAVTEHYKNDPLILYDLIPEPHNTTKEKLYDSYYQLIKVVREVNPRSLIFVTGLGWGRNINNYLDEPMPHGNIVYRSNPYNKPAEFPGLFGEVSQKYPVFLGEFGEPPMSLDDVKSLLDYANQLGLGWTAWNFQSVGCPCLLADWQTFSPTPYGKIIQDALAKQPNKFLIQSFSPKPESGLVVYDNSFQSGFVEQGWGRTVDLQSEDSPYLGNFGIKLTITNGYGGLGLHTFDLIDLLKYKYLTFYINFGQVKPVAMKVSLDDSRERQIGEADLESFLTQDLRTWFKAKIPLASFGVQNQLISGISIKEAVGNIPPLIFIDEIKFE